MGCLSKTIPAPLNSNMEKSATFQVEHHNSIDFYICEEQCDCIIKCSRHYKLEINMRIASKTHIIHHDFNITQDFYHVVSRNMDLIVDELETKLKDFYCKQSSRLHSMLYGKIVNVLAKFCCSLDEPIIGGFNFEQMSFSATVHFNKVLSIKSIKRLF
ncbi:hypothetical protein Ddc_17946 [Ditylenchus destructor]|nr:hypothetical protein Ddc_17946 [Ditylenchus destructor]